MGRVNGPIRNVSAQLTGHDATGVCRRREPAVAVPRRAPRSRVARGRGLVSHRVGLVREAAGDSLQGGNVTLRMPDPRPRTGGAQYLFQQLVDHLCWSASFSAASAGAVRADQAGRHPPPCPQWSSRNPSAAIGATTSTRRPRTTAAPRPTASSTRGSRETGSASRRSLPQGRRGGRPFGPLTKEVGE
jgi:hypothetical protein